MVTEDDDMKTKTLQLEAISCPSCIAKIEKALGQQKGVETTEVLFNASKVRVIFDEENIDEVQIVKVIDNLGYKVKSIK